MTPMVPIAMFGWLLVVPIMFWRMQVSRRAVVAAFVLGWLFLPMYTYELPGPDYSKAYATCIAVLLAALIFDSRRLLSISFIPSLIDLPIIIWCLCPLATAISNAPELTFYDGLSACFEQVVTWGIPYFIGRVYFSHLKGMRDLTIGVFLGGLIYVPLCLAEMRFSPQMHMWVYGFHQHGFEQTIRDDGYRPMVFMEHGLAVAMYMTSASLAGVWLWKTKSLTRVLGMPIAYTLVPLLITSMLLRSTAAFFFLLLGLGLLFASDFIKTRLLVYAVMTLPLIYISARVVARWDAPEVIGAIDHYLGEGRAHSLAFRIMNERIISTRAEKQRLFGWGLFGRAYGHDWQGNMMATPDSLWIITYGQEGTVGLIALGFLMLPIVVALNRLPPLRWSQPQYVGLVFFAVQLALFALDNLLNNMPNPIFLLGLGGLAGLVAAPPVQRRIVQRRNDTRLERLLANGMDEDPTPVTLQSFQRSTHGYRN